MNRRAKRNKYRREKAKLENTIEMLTLRNAFCDAQKKDIVTLSAFEARSFTDAYSVLEPPQIKEYKKQDICKQFAQTILNNFDFVRKTESDCGIRYDLMVVKFN
jgi:hypothetical protein